MYLGLDLRGGVHFLLQVDMQAALDKKATKSAPEPVVVVERPKKARKKRSDAAGSRPRTEKDILLDSVLEALPAPKAPGQGRSRRRVTTAALAGTPVAPTTGGES